MNMHVVGYCAAVDNSFNRYSRLHIKDCSKLKIIYFAYFSVTKT